jgi:leucyl/phenylalanyl-tRNA---protein transferase
MFSHTTDASKIALAHLCRYLDAQRFGLIDCQMNTPHLASLGARELARSEFIDHLRELTAGAANPGRWTNNGASGAWL